MADLKFPADLKYARSDEWIRFDSASGEAVIGVSDYAQDALSDVVYVELPDANQAFAQGAAFANVESTKAASEVNMPVAGTIITANSALEDDTALVNNDPYGDGWFVRIRVANPAELDGLMDADAYRAYCAGRG
jgi:glycine cleavage system H protein